MGRDGDFSGKQHPVHFESSTFCLENEDYGMGLAGHVCGGCSPENSELGQRGEFQSDWCQISRPHRKAVLLFPLSPEPARPPPPHAGLGLRVGSGPARLRLTSLCSSGAFSALPLWGLYVGRGTEQRTEHFSGSLTLPSLGVPS